MSFFEDDEYDDDDDRYPIGTHWVERVLLKSRIVSKSVRPLTMTEGYLIDSCLNRGDIEQAEKFIRDWNSTLAKPKRCISKWIPGNHYYALSEKFNSLEDAINHLKINGFEYDGLQERFQYRENGG